MDQKIEIPSTIYFVPTQNSVNQTSTTTTDSVLFSILNDATSSPILASSSLQLLFGLNVISREELTTTLSPQLDNLLPIVHLITNGKYQLLESLLQLNIIDTSISYFLYPTSISQINPTSSLLIAASYLPSSEQELEEEIDDLINKSTEQLFLESYLKYYHFYSKSDITIGNTNINVHHYKTIYQLACYAPTELFLPTIGVLYKYGYNIHQLTSQHLTLLQTLVLSFFQPKIHDGYHQLQLISTLIQFQLQYFDVKQIHKCNATPSLYSLALASGSIEICQKILSQQRFTNFDPTTSLPYFHYLLFSQSTQFIDKLISYHTNHYLSSYIPKSQTHSLIIVELFNATSQYLSITQQLKQPALINNTTLGNIDSDTITSFHNHFINILLHLYRSHFTFIIDPLTKRLHNNSSLFHPLIKYCSREDTTSIITNIIKSPTLTNKAVTKDMKSSFITSKTTYGDSLLDLSIKTDNYEIFNELYALTTTFNTNQGANQLTLFHHIATLPPQSNQLQFLRTIINSNQFKVLAQEQKLQYIHYENDLNETSIDAILKATNSSTLFPLIWGLFDSKSFHTSGACKTFLAIMSQDVINPMSHVETIIKSPQFLSLSLGARLLLTYDTNSNGQTIFDICIETNRLELFKMCYLKLHAGVNFSLIGSWPANNTLLHSLAMCHDYEFIIKFISQQLAFRSSDEIICQSAYKNYNNQTPIDIAAQYNNEFFIKLVSFHIHGCQCEEGVSTILHNIVQYSFLFREQQSTLDEDNSLMVSNPFFDIVFDSNQFSSLSQQKQIEFISHYDEQGQNVLQIAATIDQFNFILSIIQLFEEFVPTLPTNLPLQSLFSTIFQLLLQHFIIYGEMFSNTFMLCFSSLAKIYQTQSNLFNSQSNLNDKLIRTIIIAYQRSIYQQHYEIISYLQPILTQLPTPIDIDELILFIDIHTIGTNNTYEPEEIELIHNIFTLSKWPQCLITQYPSLQNVSSIQFQKVIVGLRASNPNGWDTSIIITRLIEIAIQSESIPILQQLVQSYLAIDKDHFPTFLQLSINTNNVKIFTILHEAGYLDLKSKQRILEDLTPFHYIIKYQKMNIFNYLISKYEFLGIGPFTTSIQSPLRICQNNYLQNLPGYSFFHLLLQLPIKQQESTLFQFLKTISYSIQENNNQLTQRLGFNPNAIDSFLYHTYSALFMACVHGKIDSVKLLINIGDIFKRSDCDETIFMAIACSGQIELYKYIHDLIQQRQGQDPTIDFNSKYYDINFQSNIGHNVLSLAVSYNHIEFIKYLDMHYKPQYNYKSTTTGMNLLHCATLTTNASSPQCLEYIYPLVKQHYNINDIDNNGNTPLFTAVMNNNQIAYDFLLQHKADPFAVRNDGRNLYHAYALYHSNQSIINDLYDLITFIHLGVQDYQFESKIFFNSTEISINHKDTLQLTPNELCYIQTITNSIQQQQSDYNFYKVNNIKLRLPHSFNSASWFDNLLSYHPLLFTHQLVDSLIKLLLQHNIDPTNTNSTGYNIITIALRHNMVQIAELIWDYPYKDKSMQSKMLQHSFQNLKPFESIFGIMLNNQKPDQTTINFIIKLIDSGLVLLTPLQAGHLTQIAGIPADVHNYL